MILNWILALASALLLVLAFPPYGYTGLAPIALAPLLAACLREARWKHRFGFGYISGAAYWFGTCHWIQWTLAHHGGMGVSLAWLCIVLFCLAKALQMGVFAATAGFVANRTFGPPIVAALWVVIEWTHSFTGFEWLNLGNAGIDMSQPLRLAPVTGVWGISFLFAFSGAVIAAVALAFFGKHGRHPALWLLPPAAILFMLPAVPDPNRGKAAAVVVQPNLDDEATWTPELVADTERQMRLFSLAASGKPGDIDAIVWPEVPAPFYESDRVLTRLLSEIAVNARSAVVAGVVARGTGGPLNSALMLDAAGNRISRYDKVNLVPFGEFVPWPFGLITEKVSTEAGDFESGSKVVVSGLGSHKLGTFICYESVFPSYIRQFARDGAQVLFNISNDSWFGKSAARYQHLLIVRMRAAENNRWIVRATNDGVSGAIDPAGRVSDTLPEFRDASSRVRFGYVSATTFYTSHGDWFVVLCALAAAAGVTSAGLQGRRRP